MASVNINDCTFVGNVGKDIEIKYNQAGMAICNFSIACVKSVKKNDEWESKTEWIPIVAFGKIAEYVSNKAGKGTLLFVRGEYSTSNYEKDGKKIYRTQITANTIKIISTKSENNQNIQEELPVENNDISDDLPF